MGGERELEVVLEGGGGSKEAAFSNALAGLQKSIAEGGRYLIIRIEPLEVELIEGSERRRAEKFMFFFMKRDVSVFHVKIRVKVRVFRIDMDACNFAAERDKESFFRR